MTNKFKEKRIWNFLKDINPVELLNRFHFLYKDPYTSINNFINFLENPNKKYTEMFKKAFWELNKIKGIPVNYVLDVLKDYKLNWYIFDFVDNIHVHELDRNWYLPNKFTPYYLIEKESNLYIKINIDYYKKTGQEELVPNFYKQVLELEENLKKTTTGITEIFLKSKFNYK